jgi:hypothetical protein
MLKTRKGDGGKHERDQGEFNVAAISEADFTEKVTGLKNLT